MPGLELLSAAWNIICIIALFGGVGIALWMLFILYYWHDVLQHRPKVPERHIVGRLLTDDEKRADDAGHHGGFLDDGSTMVLDPDVAGDRPRDAVLLR